MYGIVKWIVDLHKRSLVTLYEKNYVIVIAPYGARQVVIAYLAKPEGVLIFGGKKTSSEIVSLKGKFGGK